MFYKQAKKTNQCCTILANPNYFTEFYHIRDDAQHRVPH
ncbi:hypothetical protein OIU84_000803 [Salix udensis]|uniref:Uncharacterized protein n=1 Tax=Salix udensis TaxID=889485 RepID=A0AAD6L5J9_9ROSI|nr:hypothetical protein OIU84_000803 [Salix udensis]